MITLSIDRSTPHGSWALFRDQKSLTDAPFVENRPRSPTWFPAILDGLGAHSLKPADVTDWVVGTGPGSFSGIRAVIAALQGLSLPHKRSVWGVQSAAALAFAEYRRTGKSKISVVGDARRNELWHLNLDFESDMIKTALAQSPVLISRESVMRVIPADTRVLSPDFSRLSAILGTLRACDVVEDEAYPTAKEIAEFFFAFPEIAIRDPLPVYLHPAVQ